MVNINRLRGKMLKIMFKTIKFIFHKKSERPFFKPLIFYGISHEPNLNT